jgi:hypothetical protein
MKFKLLALTGTALLLSGNAFAYTRMRCDTADNAKVISILFDAANNYFVNASLTVGENKSEGEHQGDDLIRPRPNDPNHPLLTVKFGTDIFVLAVDGKSATFTGVPMACCTQIGTKSCQPALATP